MTARESITLSSGWLQVIGGVVTGGALLGVFVGRLMFAPAAPTALSLDSLGFKMAAMQDDMRGMKTDVTEIKSLLTQRIPPVIDATHQRIDRTGRRP